MLLLLSVSCDFTSGEGEGGILGGLGDDAQR